MSDELVELASQIVVPSETLTPEGTTGLLPGTMMETPSAEQVEAAETAFSREQESHLVAGLIGMWAGTAMLHDLTAAHLSRPVGEEEEEETARRRKAREPRAK